MSDIKDFIIEDGVLIRYVGAGEENVVIPDGVTAIGNEAFKNKVFIKTVFIPNTVTHIGYDAFSGCRGLISVDIPNSVTSTYNAVFDGCSNLKSVSLSNALNYIGSRMFYGCSSLESICIPDSVTVVGEYAFGYCKNLKSVIIPPSVTTIENNAFFMCESLTNVVVSHSIENIGYSAFPKNEKLMNEEGFIIFGDYLYAYKGNEQEVIISNNISRISSYAFSSCKSLTSIVVPNTVTKIGDAAFKNCENLKYISLPDSIKEIGSSCFSGCINLANVNIPNSVTKMGTHIFAGCTQISEIVIPEGITDVWGMFDGCKNLLSVTIPDSVTKIGDHAFTECKKLKKISIPDGVEYIGSLAFYGCTSLTDLTIPANVESIGYAAFSKCSAITSITIYNKDLIIEEEAFACKNLKNMIVPEGLKISNNIFGSKLPVGLYENIDLILPLLSASVVKKYLLNLKVWTTLSVDLQTEIFIEHQAKSLVSAYRKCIDEDDANEICNKILTKVSQKASVKECNIVGSSINVLYDIVSSDTLKKLYAYLSAQKNAQKALKLIQTNEEITAKLGEVILPQDLPAPIETLPLPASGITVFIDDSPVPCEESYTGFYIKSKKLAEIMANDVSISELFSIVNTNGSGITNDEIVIKLSDAMGIEGVSVPRKRKNIIKSLIEFLKKAPSAFSDFTNQTLDFEDLICELKENEEAITLNIKQAEWFQYLDGGYGSGLEDNTSFARLLEKKYKEQGVEHITVIRKFEYNYAESKEKYEQVIQ